MTINDYGFHFEPAGRGGTQGAIDPAQEHFTGSAAEVSVVREPGQNSGDHPSEEHEGPIRMEYELVRMATSDIPDIEGLRLHMRWVTEQTVGQQGHERMLRALEVAESQEISVLRISDYGTTGLTGGESVNENRSPLSALTRGAGTSSDDGTRGGSFGIGSAVGPMASELSTVLYVSLPEDDDRTVFAGYSRLAGHKDDVGEWRQADGFFTRIDADDFEYLRPAPTFGSFAPRTEPGTDIFILGYRMAEQDPDLRHLLDAAVDNFMAAVMFGKLEIKGIIDGETRWELTGVTLDTHVGDRWKAAAFLQALRDPTPDVAEIEGVGEVRLYVNVDTSLEHKLHTITMRGPLMRIDTFKHHSIRVPYAAVLICPDPEGNAALRRLEPPRHDRWDPGRDPENGQRIVGALKTFVRHSLAERVRSTLGDTVEVRGLARFLPIQSVGAEDETVDGAAPGTSGGGSDAEASTVTGDPSGGGQRRTRRRRSVPVRVRQPAVADGGDEEIKKGKDTGGPGKRSDRGDPGLPGEGSEGDGRGQIRRGDVKFRSWADTTDPGTTVLSLTPHEDCAGDLALVAVGPADRWRMTTRCRSCSPRFGHPMARQRSTWLATHSSDWSSSEGRRPESS